MISEEAIYWIFSTLPQVLAALTGLVMTGLTIYDNNINKEISESESKSSAAYLAPLLKSVYKRAKWFFGCSILSIIVDVIILFYAREFAWYLQNLDLLAPFNAVATLVLLILLILINLAAIALIIPIISPVLNPSSRKTFRDKEIDIVKSDLKKYEYTSSRSEHEKSEGGEESTDSKSSGTQESSTSVKPIFFIEYFREFERAVREFFPSSSGSFKNEGLTSLVRKLSDDGIISDDELPELIDIIKLRNLYIHGGKIGDVDNRIIKRLEDVTASLKEKIIPYKKTLRKSKIEELFDIWIRNNVEDLDDAFNLEQAIRFHQTYGQYRVSINGYYLIVRPTHGNSLRLRHNEVELFIKMLEQRFVTNSGFSIEEQKFFNDALRKIHEEDADDDREEDDKEGSNDNGEDREYNSDDDDKDKDGLDDEVTDTDEKP